jgi:hypothetical protein
MSILVIVVDWTSGVQQEGTGVSLCLASRWPVIQLGEKCGIVQHQR